MATEGGCGPSAPQCASAGIAAAAAVLYRSRYNCMEDPALVPMLEEHAPEPVDYRPVRDQLYESLDQWSAQRFKRFYRMTKGTFDLLMTRLLACPSAGKNLPVPPSVGLNSKLLPPEHRVLIALRYLASTDQIASLAVAFNITDSMVFDNVTQVANVILELEADAVKWPSLQQMALEEASIFGSHGFPGCIGAVDGTHIVITKPKEDGEVYFNRKKQYSLNAMLLVNHQLEILYYSVGSPGSYHDSRVFRRSNLPDLLESLPSQYHVLGDSAYPLMMGLLKPYPDNSQNPRRVRQFNYKLSAARSMVEHANARLKNKFSRLKNIQCRSVDRARLLVRTSIILHNFIIRAEKEESDVTARPLSSLPRAASHIAKREAISKKL